MISIDVSQFCTSEQTELNAQIGIALHFTVTIKAQDHSIEAEVEKMAGFEEITCLMGFGTLIAAIFLSGSGDVNDFDYCLQTGCLFWRCLKISTNLI